MLPLPVVEGPVVVVVVLALPVVGVADDDELTVVAVVRAVSVSVVELVTVGIAVRVDVKDAHDEKLEKVWTPSLVNAHEHKTIPCRKRDSVTVARRSAQQSQRLKTTTRDTSLTALRARVSCCGPLLVVCVTE